MTINGKSVQCGTAYVTEFRITSLKC